MLDAEQTAILDTYKRVRQAMIKAISKKDYPVLVAVIVSVIVTTVILNNKEPKKDPNLSPETS